MREEAIPINDSVDLTEENNTGYDCWTLLSTLSELPGVVSDIYWFGNLFDLCLDLKPEIFQLSYVGLGVGIALGLFATAGNMYCQNMVNFGSQSHEDSQNPANENSADAEYQASCWRKMFNYSMVAGDFLDTAAYKAAPVVFTAELATQSNPLSRWPKIGVNAVAGFIGFWGSVANARTALDKVEEADEAAWVQEQRTKIV